MEVFDTYRDILKSELIYATGCTEPIAIAYAAAVAVETLGERAERLKVLCSGNIVKNVKSVIVPGTGGLRGIEAAAVIGAVGSDPGVGLNVLHRVTDADRAEAARLLELGVCEVGLLDSDEPLHILLEAEGAAHSAKVEIKGSHTNIISRCFDGAELLSGRGEDEIPDAGPDYDCLSLRGIIDYAENTDLEGERELLESQINCNRAVAIEGFLGEYGLNVGRSLLEHANYGPYVRAAAMAASGSDARMAGCQMPVVINSGSGNQGLTVSLPVISLSESWDSNHEQLLRALLISNLVSVHVKRHIGRLSAYCGATSAASGVAAAATWLRGGSREEIAGSVVNTLAVVSGMICDGAKASCAAKIAAALDSAFLAHRLAMQGKRYPCGDGIVAEDAEDTIRKIGILGSKGMAGTDREILKLMLD